MTTDDAVAVILRYSTEFGSIGADYVKVAEDTVFNKNVVQII